MRSSNVVALALLGSALAWAPTAHALEVAAPALPAPDAQAPHFAQPPPSAKVARVDRPPRDRPTAEDVLAPTLAIFVLTDLGFGIYDTAVAWKGRLPSHAAAIAESVLAAPQVFGCEAAMTMAIANRDEQAAGLLTLASAAANSMLAHGIWGARTTTAPAGVLFGVSAAIGFDTAFTSSAFGHGLVGKLPGVAPGISQMTFTLPQIIAGSYGINHDTAHVGAWTGLTAWSSALFLHGFVSAIVGARAEPPKPPEPEPVEPARPPLLVPKSMRMEMTPVEGGAMVGVRGELW